MRSPVFLVLTVLLSAGLSAPAAAQESAPATASLATGRVTVIQAVPGAEIDIAVDAEPVRQGAGVGTILGPLDLAPGPHEITFSGGGVEVTSMLQVASGSSNDVVLHEPAAVGGDPVVNSYDIPLGPIGPQKSRVLIAHTATVAPADVVVDGQVVFSNIANGEFADADVPSGPHQVSLLPTGQQGSPILGPLDVTLQPETITMVYAYGSPSNGSMNVISRTESLGSDGSRPPRMIDTGSAGLVADARITPFGAGSAAGSSSAGPGDRIAAAPGSVALLVLVTLGLGVVLGGIARRRAGRGLGRT